jgi:hypothetical protein
LLRGFAFSAFSTESYASPATCLGSKLSIVTGLVEAVGVGERVAEAVGVGERVAEAVGVGEGVADVLGTFIPLLQTSFFPDLIHVYLYPAEVTVKFNFLHVAPDLIAACETLAS